MLDWLRALFSLLVFPGFAFVFVCALAFQWIDRKLSARFQGRVGPPWFQPLADLIKLMAKEDIMPAGAYEQAASVLTVVSVAAVLTVTPYVPIAGAVASSFEGDLIVVLFLLSIPSFTYFLAGWLSVSVYSLVGGSRAVLQYFAYEVPFLMALSGPAIVSHSWSVSRIAEWQSRTAWVAIMQPVGFLLAIIGLIGKLKRPPLDIPKAKTEVSAGPLTEFSGRKLALWYLMRDMQGVIGIFLLVNLFLGGSAGGGVHPAGLAFALKAMLLLVILSTVGVLYARLRIDQLASLGWRVLAPLALVQLLVTVWTAAG